MKKILHWIVSLFTVEEIRETTMPSGMLDANENPITTTSRKRSFRFRWGPIAGTLAAVTLLLTQVNGIIDFAEKRLVKPTPTPSPTPESRVSPLAYNYARLFGAFQVPFVVFDMNYEDTNLLSKYKVIRPDYKSTKKSWSEGDLGKATFALGPIYDELNSGFQQCKEGASNSDNPFYIMASYKSPTFLETYQFLDRWQSNLSEDKVKKIMKTLKAGNTIEDDDIGYFMETANTKINTATQKTQFTFIVIENNSSTVEKDIEISYDYYNNSAPFKKMLVTSDHIIPEGIPVVKDQTLEIASMKPGEKRLLLLSISYIGQGKYPAEYFTSVIVPRQIRQTKKDAVTIASPKMDKAAKVSLPMGWHQQ